MKKFLRELGGMLILLSAMGFVYLILIWNVSFVTSMVKKVNSDCGDTYAIDKVPLLSSNWFCGSEK